MCVHNLYLFNLYVWFLVHLYIWVVTKIKKEQRFSRGHLARTRSRRRPLVEYLQGRGRDKARNFSLFLGLFEEETRNFGLFLSHFKEETFDPCFSRSRTRQGEEFCLIPRPFRGQDETIKNLWFDQTKTKSMFCHHIKICQSLRSFSDNYPWI